MSRPTVTASSCNPLSADQQSDPPLISPHSLSHRSARRVSGAAIRRSHWQVGDGGCQPPPPPPPPPHPPPPPLLPPPPQLLPPPPQLLPLSPVPKVAAPAPPALQPLLLRPARPEFPEPRASWTQPVPRKPNATATVSTPINGANTPTNMPMNNRASPEPNTFMISPQFSRYYGVPQRFQRNPVEPPLNRALPAPRHAHAPDVPRPRVVRSWLPVWR